MEFWSDFVSVLHHNFYEFFYYALRWIIRNIYEQNIICIPFEFWLNIMQQISCPLSTIFSQFLCLTTWCFLGVIVDPKTWNNDAFCFTFRSCVKYKYLIRKIGKVVQFLGIQIVPRLLGVLTPNSLIFSPLIPYW